MKKIVFGVAGGIVLAWLLISSLGIAAAVAPSFMGLMHTIVADPGFWVFVALIAAGAAYYFLHVRGTHTLALRSFAKKPLIAAVVVFGSLGLLSLFIRRGDESQPPVPASEQAEPGSAWRYGYEKDEMEGTSIRVARLAAERGQPTGTSTTPVWLVVRRGGDVFIEADGLTCSFDGKVTQIRIDEGPVEFTRCRSLQSRSRNSGWLDPMGIGGPTPTPYLDRLYNAERVVISVPTIDGGFQAVFNVSGLEL